MSDAEYWENDKYFGWFYRPKNRPDQEFYIYYDEAHKISPEMMESIINTYGASTKPITEPQGMLVTREPHCDHLIGYNSETLTQWMEECLGIKPKKPVTRHHPVPQTPRRYRP